MKNRLRDDVIVWGAMLVMVGFTIWISYLGIQGIDWIFERVSELKEAYFTPNVPELAVVACALLCLGCFLVIHWLLIKAKARHPAAGILCAGGSIVVTGLCWTVYLFASQNMDFQLCIRWFIWLMILGQIAGRLENNCKIAYVSFWPVFFLSLNEYFGIYPSLSMTGVQVAEKDFLEHHFGLTQLIMLSYAALLLATPSAFKWIWFDAKKERDEMMRKILGPLEEAAALDDLPKTEGDKPSNQ
jgi:hypothetical protein